jgi:hypothetical protein
MKEEHCERHQLFALAERLLAGREEREVAAHVTECAGCRAIVESYRNVDSALDAWKPLEPSPWFDARVRAAVRAAEPANRPRTLFGLEWSRVLSPALAAMLVVVAGTVILRDRLRPGSHPGEKLAAVQVIHGNPAAPAQTQRAQSAQQELKMYENLGVLEDYDLLANIEGIPEPAQRDAGATNVAD